MSNWIELNPESLNKNEEHIVNGIEVVVGLSPYDIPEMVRGHYDGAIKKFVIEFKYLDGQEPRKSISGNEHVTLAVGAHSGRLYAIQIDVDELSANAVKLSFSAAGNRFPDEVVSAIDSLRGKNPLKERHYAVARAVISDKARELLAETG